MNAEYKAMCERFEAEEIPPTVAGPLGLIQLIRQFLNAWNAAGMTGNFWTWLPIILQLIQVLGPKIQEIIELIREAIDRGKTPAEVFAAYPG